MSMDDGVAANKPRNLTGAVALTQSDQLYQDKVAKQTQSSATSGIQLGQGNIDRCELKAKYMDCFAGTVR